jgi:hypothetical protein
MSSLPTAPQGADTISTVPTPRAGSTGTEAPARPAASFGDCLPGDLREGYADIGDVQLHYVEAGEGPLVVLLHGFPEFWYGWRLQIQPLAAAGFRVVAPDMRGYNLSSRPAAGGRRGLRLRHTGRRRPRPDPRTRRPVRAAGRS